MSTKPADMDSRERILQAAVELMSKEGLPALSMREVARELLPNADSNADLKMRGMRQRELLGHSFRVSQDCCLRDHSPTWPATISRATTRSNQLYVPSSF